MYSKNILSTLQSIGFVGSWHIDFTTHKMRGDGKIGHLFGISNSKTSIGVNLDLLDRAYTKEDLEMIKRHRRRIAGVGGFYNLKYRLMDPKLHELVPVQSMMHVRVDPYGALKEAKGILLRAPASLLKPANCNMTHEEAILRLNEAAKAVDALGHESMNLMLQVACRELARNAAKEKAYLSRPDV